ncbi:MAG: hypothetical protein J7L25_11085 [Deltaproteobacteria bacterium]|nr:hypothetical protein [Candidatus Tharpella aukensis]
MNITLSVDEKVISRSRQFAKEHNTTLNSMVREFLRKISGDHDRQSHAEEFLKLAKNEGGESRPGYVFNREELHER